jgi:hypothetical protein
MSDIGVVGVAKRAVKALHDGEINSETSYKLFTRVALEQFPESKSEAEATEKFRQTVHGQEWFNAERQASFVKMQVDHALSANETLIKAFGNPATRQSAFETPSVARPSDEPRLNAGRISGPEPWDPAVFNRAVELLMRERNCSRDVAITEIHRAEKSKGSPHIDETDCRRAAAGR